MVVLSSVILVAIDVLVMLGILFLVIESLMVLLMVIETEKRGQNVLIVGLKITQ